MRHCPDCRVGISTITDVCPLCHRPLQGAADADAMQTYPPFSPSRKAVSRWSKPMTITAVSLIAAAGVANLWLWSGTLWSVIFIACVLYAWLLGLFTCNKRIHLGYKLIVHAVSMPLLLAVVNMFATRTETIQRVSWAVSYGLPITLICFIAAINSIMVKWKQKRRDYLLYQLSLCVIGFIPLVLALTGVARPALLSVIAAGCSYLTIVWMLVFARRIISAEFARRFHV